MRGYYDTYSRSIPGDIVINSLHVYTRILQHIFLCLHAILACKKV